jgi:hypothetical protein
MIIVSLRGAFAATKQSPVREGCFAIARNDMWAKVNALRELQSASGEELSPSLRFGDGAQSALMPSILDKVFKREL